MFEAMVGPVHNPEYYTEEYVEFCGIATRILGDHKNGKLKTLAELYGEEAFAIGTHDIQDRLFYLNDEESGDSGMNLTGTSRYESKECCEADAAIEADIEDNGKFYINRQYFCSSVKGSQEPIRFSPGLSPIRYG